MFIDTKFSSLLHHVVQELQNQIRHNNIPYTSNNSPPINNSTQLVLLQITCQPSFYIQPNETYLKIVDFIQSHLENCARKNQDRRISSLLLSWLSRHNTPFLLHNTSQQTYGCPPDMSLLINLVIEDVLHRLKKNIPPNYSVNTTDSPIIPLSPTPSPGLIHISNRPTLPPTSSPSPPSNASETPISNCPPHLSPTEKNHHHLEPKTQQHAPYPIFGFRKRNIFQGSPLTRARLDKFKQSLLKRTGINQYNNSIRHLPGTMPKLTIGYCRPDPPLKWNHPTPKEERLRCLNDLLSLHQYITNTYNLLAPRDTWEQWIDEYADSPDADRGFMCLAVILMSSSTSDKQLALLVPRLFSMGFINAQSTIDIATTYGMDVVCSLMSESGKYYVNGERIVNAADYFIVRHNGRLPSSITIEELTTLPGVGYKTATLVISYSFRRNDGIPSDIHVLKWARHLKWIPPYCQDGSQCSNLLECWIPKQQWQEVNPLFGALGQLLGSKGTKQQVRRCVGDFILKYPTVTDLNKIV